MTREYGACAGRKYGPSAAACRPPLTQTLANLSDFLAACVQAFTKKAVRVAKAGLAQLEHALEGLDQGAAGGAGGGSAYSTSSDRGWAGRRGAVTGPAVDRGCLVYAIHGRQQLTCSLEGQGVQPGGAGRTGSRREVCR